MSQHPSDLYRRIGAKGLEELANEFKVSDDIVFVKKRAKKDESILDLACGYGRVSIPLVTAGYKNVTGIDLAQNLIRAAKKKAKLLGIKIKFDVGTMTALPYENNSFDRVFCLWNSFNHLFSKRDQKKTLNEVYRVLKPKGKAFFVVYDGEGLDIKNKIKTGELKKDAPILKAVIKGIESPLFIYTKAILKNLLSATRFRKVLITRTHLNARRRILLQLEK